MKRTSQYDPVFDSIRNTLISNDDFLITSHIHPDGDSLASALVLSDILKQLNKHSVIIIDDEIPVKYRFFPGIENVRRFDGQPVDNEKAICCVLDASNLDRLGSMKSIVENAKTSINIDHHARNQRYATINWVDGCESSTVEMVYQLLVYLDCKLSGELATLIYSGIVCDTGRFRFPNTTYRSMSVCVEMLRQGISASAISEQIYYKKHPDTLKALGRCLENLELKEDGRIGILTMTLSDTRDFPEADTEGFVEYLHSIDGTEINFICKEKDPDVFRVSLRSKTDVDVSLIAESFQGGGHAKAAGCTVNGSIESVKNRVLEVIKSSLKTKLSQMVA